jgi:hypothetical protein
MSGLEEHLRTAIRPVFLKHIDHSIKQTLYDQQAGAVNPDQTRAEMAALKVVNEILVPRGFQFISVKFRSDFTLLVQAGTDEENLTINFLMTR